MDKEPLILLVDDDQELRLACQQGLDLAGFRVEAHAVAQSALDRLTPNLHIVIVSDIRMPGMDGFAFVQQVRNMDPEIPIVFITGHANAPMAVAALKGGAFDFLTKPFAMSDLAATVGQAVGQRKKALENRWLQQLANDYGDHPLVGHSQCVEQLRRDIDALAHAGLDTVVVGETGVGKELVARLLQRRGPRRQKALVTINCASLNDGNVDEVLFGSPVRPGKLEQAQGGVLLLDEMDSMPISVQPHFLRLLEDRVLARPGARHVEPLDIQFVASAKVDLKEAAERRLFRSDLYYRLAGATIIIPPLRERPEDILPIFATFCGLAADEFNREIPITSDDVLAYLLTHHWPGNAHELRHFAFRHVLCINKSGSEFETSCFNDKVALFEKALIEKYLREHGGDVSLVAEIFAMPRKTLYDKLKKYNFDSKSYRNT
ncbi:sigma-54-dependent transcriptional regulator [Novosphingobium sediminicola]|uniref:Two-component system C4-dicarboxylate transport response regulator DctD n=1 Tax=Novosphingobium sediminicola TaxID=563162 RepID=A0A7W6G6G9_9SPHN|nr:sigma-54 dependent transcriptional regulator [Novosphingobium sediminicola]MBB3953952.1 two-component system C4-dicarboxylate transport response regulator DctD [Novosphingobium sediminicola]